jgi:hypothetical protein
MKMKDRIYLAIMKEFNEWMVEKGCGTKNLLNDGINFLIAPTPQMLIGYQLEFLGERCDEVDINYYGTYKNWWVTLNDGKEHTGKTLSEALTKAISYVEV